MAVGASACEVASSSNSLILSISVPMEMLVTRSRITSITTGTWNSFIQASAWAMAGAQFFLPVHADRLAAQAFDHLHVVDAVARSGWRRPAC